LRPADRFIETFVAALARLDSPDDQNRQTMTDAAGVCPTRLHTMRRSRLIFRLSHLPSFSSEYAWLKKYILVNGLMPHDQSLDSGTKIANKLLGLRRSGEAEELTAVRPPPGEQTKWILAGFHDGISCKAVL